MDSINRTAMLRVLVTGTSSGIGRALAEHYARAGATVGAVARRGEVLREMARAMPGIFPLAADVADGAAMEAIVRRFAEQAGGLDLVYANAGIGQRNPEEGWEPGRARQIAEINVLGATNTIAPAVSLMLERGWGGRIVGISSLAGCTPLPAAAAYGASKAWLKFYLESLDMDLAPRGIRCSVVMPGHVATAMVDGEKAGLITEGARRAARLIAARVERGDRIIKFPRRVAMLATLAAFAPPGLRARSQRGRLAKRKELRSESS